MNDHEQETPAVDALVDAMMQSYGQLALILDHMGRNEDRAPGAEPIPTVFRRLLSGILAALPERHGLDDVATAAQMLAAATELIGDEVYLVTENRATRRRRRPG
jgi:hypothetical protein